MSLTGFGLVPIFQLLPFQRSMSVRPCHTLLRSSTVEEPTAKQADTATNANTANTANHLSALTWTPLSLENGWVAGPTSYGTPSFAMVPSNALK